MTDADVQLFLTLKFSSMPELVDALRYAVGVGPLHSATDAAVNEVLKEWAIQGCPEKIVIPDNKASLFLCFKFGTVKQAYEYWVSVAPGEPHGLCDAELTIVMDYVAPPRS